MIIYTNHLHVIDFDGEELLSDEYNYFVQFSLGLTQDTYAGWKFTIIGSSVDDSLHLLNTVGRFLVNIGVTFKCGTKRLVESNIPEQHKKLMTIYIPKHIDAKLLESDLKYLLSDYNVSPELKLEHSEHVFGPLYKRYDRDVDGNYVPAVH